MISVAMLFDLGKLYHDGVEAVNENYSTGFALEGARSMEPNLLQHGDHLSCWPFLRRKGGGVLLGCLTGGKDYPSRAPGSDAAQVRLWARRKLRVGYNK